MKKMISIMAACLLVVGLVGIASADPCAQCEANPGYINRGCDTSQTVACYPFDYEDFGKDLDGDRCARELSGMMESYCSTGSKGDFHRAIFKLCDCFPNLTTNSTLYVAMEILVDKGTGTAVAGDNGVYWAQHVNSILAETFTNETEICNQPACDKPADSFAGPFEYWYFDNGAKKKSTKTPDSGAVCDIADDRRITEITSSAAAKGFTGFNPGEATMWIDIPWMRVDNAMVQRGWKVYVKICMSEKTGQICTTTDCCCVIYIGELCCPTSSSSGCAIVFPYFTAADSGWWSGVAITNGGSKAGTVDLTVYEADGDVFELVEPLAISANGMLVYNQATLYGLDWTAAGTGDGIPGNARFYVKAVGDVPVMGFGMMAKTSTGESMGYLAVPLCDYCCK
jgi:hypothetical protein